MKKYRISWEQKDYGYGEMTRCNMVEADSENDALATLRRTRCGVEHIFSCKEV